jgi:hypothetical protein
MDDKTVKGKYPKGLIQSKGIKSPNLFFDEWVNKVVPPSVEVTITDETTIEVPKDLTNLMIGHMYPTGISQPEDSEKEIYETTIKMGSFVGKDDYSKHFKGDLTPDEIRQLPLELKACFMIQPWDKKFAPRSIEEWANGLGWLAFREKNFLTSERCITDWRQDAINVARKYFEFINEHVVISLSSSDFEKLVKDFDSEQSEYTKAINREYAKAKKETSIDENIRRNWF